jgi:hypothetical protein
MANSMITMAPGLADFKVTRNFGVARELDVIEWLAGLER